MQRVVPIAFLVLALVVVAVMQWQAPGSKAGFDAPPFSLPDLDGRSHDLGDYAGRVVFLNVWATWCPPCREEMPSMQRLHESYAQEGLVVLAVSEDEGPPEPVRAFAESLRLTFPILLDPEGVVPSLYGVTGYPETFLIDRSGRIVRHVIGPADWYAPAARAEIEQLLRQAPATGADE